MITDPKRIKLKDKGHPHKCTVFSYYKVFATSEKVNEVEHWCKNAEKGCTECKKIMADVLIEYLRPIRERRKWLEENEEERVFKPFTNCLTVARLTADATLKEAKKVLDIPHASLEEIVRIVRKKD
jgi:tryptophanyl-tRNA synthetase